MARKSADEPMVFGESLLERDFVRFCNFNPEIAKIEYQPLRLQYNYKKRARTYTPDFLLTDDQGGKTIVEVKPSQLVNDPENVVKFKVAQLFCEEQGWDFKVVTEHDLHKGQLSKNINILLDVLRVDIEVLEMMMVYECLQRAGSCSIQALHTLVPDLDRPKFTAIVYRLLLDRYFKADLVSQRLSDQTVLHINEGKEW